MAPPQSSAFTRRAYVDGAQTTRPLGRSNSLIVLPSWPNAYLDEAQQSLALAVSHDIHISKTALHVTLTRIELSREVLLTPAGERDEERRKQWREEIRADFTAEQLVFGDQVSIDKRNLQQNSLAM
ncbi:hypothetical protein FOMPIDRAFT_94227 [Fomitopsis schrenkii]|uniref:Uncharacterized protein n=1 Tax=Fomitopsis schrenkii TaxID=2126942 RepID=S8FVU5_FOMSC|nr:hypothetical protein FOMPIDRAFT_84787 [Fomitopsis schrenkii]EPT04434.1 hypothetical protein FOMPIDRAFT_94227 [Fomitopsis schrenkii]